MPTFSYMIEKLFYLPTMSHFFIHFGNVLPKGVVSLPS